MKLLIATVALATMIAAPAFAQTANQRARAEQSARAANQVNQYSRTDQRHSTNPAHDVYDNAHNYLGSDPDARVRMEIVRDRTD